jgi:hypothetical protein
MAENTTFEDIDLELDPEEEIAQLDVEEEEEEEEEEDLSALEEEEEEEEKPKEEPEPDAKSVLEELRAERQRLQAQLNELSVTTMTDRRRMTELEKALQESSKPAAKEVEQGPTPEQIIGHLDHRINQVEKALAKAELEDPSTAPELRKQLRTLERHYNNYTTQLHLQANQAVDPDLVVQQAVIETNQQNRFQAVRQQVTDQFPILDKNSKHYDKELADEIHSLYNPMLKDGYDPADALMRTVSLVTAARGILSLGQLSEWQQAQLEEKAKVEAMGKAEAEKKKATSTRKTDAVTRNIKAATDTPPNIANTGNANSDTGILGKYDLAKMGINEYMRMSDAEVQALEDATLAMWGD